MSIQYYTYNIENNDTPILAIHTSPLDSTYFIFSYEQQVKRPPIIFVDLPGHGKSSYNDPEELELTSVSNKLKSIITSLHVEKIHIIGHGIGGFYAQRFTLDFPENVSSLILINSAPNSKYRETLAWNIREKYSKVTIQALDQFRGDTSDKTIRARFTQSLATYFEPTSHETAKALMDDAKSIATQAYVDLSRSILPTINMRTELRSIRIPVFILAATKDVWPNNASQLIRNDILHAKYEEIDSGHFPMVEDADSFWDRIIDFIVTEN